MQARFQAAANSLRIACTLSYPDDKIHNRTSPWQHDDFTTICLYTNTVLHIVGVASKTFVAIKVVR